MTTAAESKRSLEQRAAALHATLRAALGEETTRRAMPSPFERTLESAAPRDSVEISIEWVSEIPVRALAPRHIVLASTAAPPRARVERRGSGPRFLAIGVALGISVAGVGASAPARVLDALPRPAALSRPLVLGPVLAPPREAQRAHVFAGVLRADDLTFAPALPVETYLAPSPRPAAPRPVTPPRAVQAHPAPPASALAPSLGLAPVIAPTPKVRVAAAGSSDFARELLDGF